MTRFIGSDRFLNTTLNDTLCSSLCRAQHITTRDNSRDKRRHQMSLAKSLLLGSCIAFVVSAPAFASLEDEIAERIKKVGTVCVEGNDCGAAASSDAGASNVGADVETNYNQTCATCHNVGVAGAPRFAQAADWKPRIAKGLEQLYKSAIDGMPPAMPAKGMCFACSDEDLKALVDYMVDSAQ